MRFMKRHWPIGLLAFFNGVLPLMLAISVVGCGIPWLPPEPEPQPPIVEPDVKPIDGVAWSIVLYESSDLNGELAILKNDPYWRTIKSRWYDVDSEDATSAVEATKDIKRPSLLLIDANGKKLWAGELPLDIEAIKKRIGGAK